MRSFIKVAAYLALAVILLLTADIAVCFVYPDVDVLKKKNPEKTSFMKYREKQWENKGLEKKIKQKWVPFSRISPYVIKAVIIAEDDKFWRHEGFDFVAMQKAIEKDIKKKKLKVGGSTISQQLAKNLFLTPAKNPVRKIKEAIYTWRIERNLSKKRIMELYLNVAEWGDALFGIEAAARRYYGKSALSLGPEEAAKLATVLPNPIKFSPVGNSRYVRNRSALIYGIMVRRGIVIEEYVEVMNEPQEETEAETNEESVPAEGSLVSTSGPDAPDTVEKVPAPVPDIEKPPVNEDEINKDKESEKEPILTMGAKNIILHDVKEVMKNRRIFIVMLFVLILSWFLASCTNGKHKTPGAVQGVIDLSNYDFVRDGPVKLSGEWEFYWKRYLEPHDFKSEIAPKDRTFINIPGGWHKFFSGKDNFPGNGYGTLRLTVITKAQAEKLSLDISYVRSAYTAYINRVQKGSAGRIVSSYSPETTSHKPHNTMSFVTEGPETEIIIHISNYHLAYGGIWDPVLLGYPKDVAKKA